MITITIDTEGNVQVSVQGIKGSSCKDLTRKLEQALGTTETRRNTPEFFEQTHVGQEARR